MSGIKETFGLISEAISTMAESGSDWLYTLAGALLLLTVVMHCAIKISTLIGDNAYSRQQKRLSRLSSLREAKKSHPDVLLEAEIDAEKAKVNRYDSWCRWRQEKTQKHRNELIENKTSQRRDSFCFTLFSLLLLLILWAIPFLLKCSGLISPEDGSVLSNIKEENLLSVVFFLAFLVLPIIWIPVYIVAYRLYRAIREANNPISIWGFSWMSASMLFSAMIAVSIETATKYTAKLLARELMLVAIAALFVPLSFAVGYVIDYIIDRWRFANRPDSKDHYHDPFYSPTFCRMWAGSNFVFWLCLSALFEVVCFESTMDNICVLVFVVILSLAAFASIVASLLCIISFICEDEFAPHGHHVIFHDGQKSKLKITNEHKIISCGLSAKSTYYQPSSRKRGLIFEGWNTQEDGHGVSIRNADDFDAMVPKDKCGEIKLYAQWKEPSSSGPTSGIRSATR
ncbi:hypothetical protein [Bifidobacterium bifidum]|uniref:hypothetical protein n=1 Tax=Bifidobacterium bifidum TaxID=1681 RepID=UPI001C24D6A7|nr:hypothetical protein [Bifidobacterium bifidum]MBU8983155.1 hypothetical protein [Bifidobacterium bifidum]MBU8986701.1 hypothetical protein [Bifidobacterium bifidum]